MGFGHAIQQRMNELRKKGANVPEVITQAQRTATLLAVEKATEMTPPNESTPIRGTGAISGEAKAHWASDSRVDPQIAGTQYTTILANNMQYISYLNDGHRMDMHFVPGLMINPYNGLLERVPRDVAGLVVGTKTKFVPGLYMRQTALATYRGAMERELDKKIRELFDR